MEPMNTFVGIAKEYGLPGLVILASWGALVWTTLRKAKTDDERADEGKFMTTALVENKNATEKFTAAMAVRTDAINSWERQMAAVVDAMSRLQTTQAAFLQTLIERDRDSRHAERDRGAR